VGHWHLKVDPLPSADHGVVLIARSAVVVSVLNAGADIEVVHSTAPMHDERIGAQDAGGRRMMTRSRSTHLVVSRRS